MTTYTTPSGADALRKELIADLRDVFDAGGQETPQIVRAVIEYADSWLSVYIQKGAESAALSAAQDAPAVPDGIPLNIIRKWPVGFNDRLQHVWLDVVSLIPSVKLYDLQRVLAEFGLRMEVYEDAPAAPQPAQPLDLGVMELAESVGLIGPESRTDDLHEAIQRFHDLIVVNASIKAARHFADGLSQQPLTDAQIADALDFGEYTAKSTKVMLTAVARAIEQAHGIRVKT